MLIIIASLFAAIWGVPWMAILLNAVKNYSGISEKYGTLNSNATLLCQPILLISFGKRLIMNQLI